MSLRQKSKTPGLLPGSGRRGKYIYESNRRRSIPAIPTNPVPSNPSVPGSGTVGGGVLGVDEVVKQVLKAPFAPVPQAGPTRWIPIPVMDDTLVVPVKTRLTELNVPFAPCPVVWKHRDTLPPLMEPGQLVVPIVPAQLALPRVRPDTLPAKPTVGPPVLTWFPPTPVMVTHRLLAAQVPPLVTVAVATNVVP